MKYRIGLLLSLLTAATLVMGEVVPFPPPPPPAVPPPPGTVIIAVPPQAQQAIEQTTTDTASQTAAGEAVVAAPVPQATEPAAPETEPQADSAVAVEAADAEPTAVAEQAPNQTEVMLQAGYGLFEGYTDRKPPVVKPRKDKLTFYPCANCHASMQTNSTPRPIVLHAPIGLVDGKLDHGQQRFWCLTCHSPDDRNHLQTLTGAKVDFNDAWKVCGQCHSARQRDWYYGAHGKRVDNWNAEAERYNCTECHNPHRPPFRQQAPKPKPPVRSGLEPMPEVKEHHKEPVWDKHADRLLPGGKAAPTQPAPAVEEEQK